MKNNIALIVGHYGPGTGTSFHGRDEWLLAQKDVEELYSELLREQLVRPLMFCIDRRELRWRILSDLLNDKADDRIKANWVKEVRADVAMEFHYNSFKTPTVEGNLLICPRLSQFAQFMDKALATLPNYHRSPMVDISDGHMDYRLFTYLDESEIPSLLIEPAFIFEDILDSDDWRPMLVAAVKHGIYDYFGLESLP